MRQNKSVSPRKPRLSICLAAIAAFVLAWVLSIPRDAKAPKGEARTLDSLNGAKQLIHEFMAEWKETPESLIELKAFALANGKTFSTYDAYGQALQYVRLSPYHFVLRSFGADAQQNTSISEFDPAIAKWKDLPRSTPLYRYLTDPNVSLYPTPLILGSNSPNLKWNAEIFLDRNAGMRQLLVRSREHDRLFLVAPHDLVEEFLWMPSSNEIIYSATSSLRYKDGIFLWDLNKNEVTDLTARFTSREKLNEGNGENNLFLSLAGIHLNGRQIYAFIAPRNRADLNPKEFLSTKSLYAITLPQGDKLTHIEPAQATQGPQSALDKKFQVTDNIFGQPLDAKIYSEWARLNFKGDIEHIVSSWQDFSEAYADSTLLPYCLWFLSSIYHDAYKAMQKNAPREADIMRSYGAELAGALSMYQTGPSYLRAFGTYIYQNLLAGNPLPYTIAVFETYKVPVKKPKGT